MTAMVKLWDLVGPLAPDGSPTGPVEISLNSVLAREALTRDPKRYSTVLPKGMHAGAADEERKARDAKFKSELESELPDPHFPPGSPKK